MEKKKQGPKYEVFRAANLQEEEEEEGAGLHACPTPSLFLITAVMMQARTTLA